MGVTLGQLHQISTYFHTQTSRQPLTLDYLLNDSYQVIAPYLQDRPQELVYLERVRELSTLRLQELPSQPPFWVVCWGDPHSGNVHFTEDNQITLFDFDQCGYGWRVFDLAKFLQVSLHAGIEKKSRDAVLAGYQTIQNLTDQELDSLPLLTQIAHIWAWAIKIKAAKVQGSVALKQNYFRRQIAELNRLAARDWYLYSTSSGFPLSILPERARQSAGTAQL